MRRIVELFLVATIMIGASGCSWGTKEAAGLVPALPDDVALTGDLVKDRDALLAQNRDLQARLAANQARVKQLDADIEADRMQANKTKLLILSVLFVIGAIVCVGLIVAYPNPAFSKIEWFGAVLFGALSVGCWFAAFILPYWHWIALGASLLVLGGLIWWVLVGRRGIKSTQLAADYADQLEAQILAFVPEERRASLMSVIGHVKDSAKVQQARSGVWGFTEQARVAWDKTQSSSK
jgi:hypothetical protein